jgi:hypothetical protein
MRDGQWSANRYRDYRRIERGGFVPNYWSGTGFTVDNWGMYGLPAPFEGGRWIRYYDDALMMGPDGRVLDGRYGMDWDRFGDRWSFDEHGVPVYVGHGDFYPTQRDYAWVEHYDQGRAYAQAPAMGPPMGAPMPGQGYGYQQAWAGSAGYSASSWGTMPIVTETVITEPATVETRTYVEERVVTSRARRVVRHHAPRHRLRCVPTCCSCPVR